MTKDQANPRHGLAFLFYFCNGSKEKQITDVLYAMKICSAVKKRKKKKKTIGAGEAGRPRVMCEAWKAETATATGWRFRRPSQHSSACPLEPFAASALFWVSFPVTGNHVMQNA